MVAKSFAEKVLNTYTKGTTMQRDRGTRDSRGTEGQQRDTGTDGQRGKGRGIVIPIVTEGEEDRQTGIDHFSIEFRIIN